MKDKTTEELITLVADNQKTAREFTFAKRVARRNPKEIRDARMTIAQAKTELAKRAKAL